VTVGAPLASWLQAIGGLGAFVATAWMALLTLRYVHAAEQTAAVSRQHQVGVARTLLEDTKRIRLQLGPPAAAEGVPALPSPGGVPRVHTWVHDIIPDIAVSDAAVVGRFMALDEWLEELKRWVGSLESIRAQRDKAIDARDGLWEIYNREAQTRGASKPEDVGVYMEQSDRVELLEQQVRSALAFADAAHRECHNQLDEIARLLAPIAAR
jgi:hypothetical protein